MSAPNNLPAVTLDISADSAPTIYQGKGLDPFFEHIKASVNEVPDLSSKKGRDRIASLAAQVSRSKTAVEKPGRDYLKTIKELPKLIEAELREFVTKCDALRDEVRQPLTEWEAEQERLAAEQRAEAERIAAEAKAAEEAAALVERIERDHELGLLLNADFDRQREAERLAAEQAQRERDERIAREAAQQAKAKAEAEAQAERDAAAKRELEAKLAAEKAEREKLEAEQRARDAEARAVQAAKDAAEREEHAAAEAVAAEGRRQELARQAEAEAQRQREANKAHQKRINGEVLADLLAAGLNEEQAKLAIVAIAKRTVRHVAISY